jgi:hypothetical protein
MSVSGGVHRCYPFWLKFEDCYKGETEPVAMCRDTFDDYMECTKRKKERRLQFRVKQELHKWKVLAVPQYNELTDAFEPVRLPADPDAYFK